jgi:hypothetical protein
LELLLENQGAQDVCERVQIHGWVVEPILRSELSFVLDGVSNGTARLGGDAQRAAGA